MAGSLWWGKRMDKREVKGKEKNRKGKKKEGDTMGWEEGEREDGRSRWMGWGRGVRGNMEDRDYRE